MVLPIGVSAPPRERPWGTAALAGAIVTIFVRVLLLRDAPFAPYCTDLTESPEAVRAAAGSLQAFVCAYGVVPEEVLEGRGLHVLVTATFVHIGWLHLVPNLLFLAAFGPRVEADLGRAGLLVLFLAGGAAGGVAHALAAPGSPDPSIGASGAVAAVLGAHWLLAPGASLRVLVGPVPVRLPTRLVIVLWAGMQALGAWLSLRRAVYDAAVSYEAHVAGLLVGVTVVGLAVRRWPALRSWPEGRAGSSGRDARRGTSRPASPVG